MNFLEHVAKTRVLAPAGIAVPEGRVCRTPGEAAAIVRELGRSIIKAQVPAGKRGKAGGIKAADTAEEARERAAAILALTIDGHSVSELLIERRGRIVREYYAAVLNDLDARCPLVLFSTEGGMDIEEVAASRPESMRRHHVDLAGGFTEADARKLLAGCDLGNEADRIADILAKMYAAFTARDAELLEINPLAVVDGKRVLALDCKLTLDDSALHRQRELAGLGAPERMTNLERQGAAAGLKFIQLDGNIGLLANGAGLTMTTMDVIQHLGGRPANFLEIGGEAYTKAEAALGLVLANPGVKSLVVNFCGAFARTDVMADGVVKAWLKLKPDIPVFFSIHGTGEEEARALVRRELGLEPTEFMEDAVAAAIAAARGAA
jgi:succinyl-CoA synthetase beta subunit